jgi:hypothetical protein
VRGKFDQFLASRSMAPGTRAALTPDQSEALFQQFLKWQITQTAPRPAVARPPAAALPQ